MTMIMIMIAIIIINASSHFFLLKLFISLFLCLFTTTPKCTNSSNCFLFHRVARFIATRKVQVMKFEIVEFIERQVHVA